MLGRRATTILEDARRGLADLRSEPAPIEIADARACGEILARGSRTFHAASRLLPRRLRPSVTAFYAYCREADDAVDEAPASEVARAVDALRAGLERIYAGRELRGAVERALSAAVAHHGIPRALFEALLEGFLWDAEGRRYFALSEVEAYAARVAGAVGVVLCLFMDRREPSVLARAADLGVAMQLTNIARDVGEDARHGRVYLPLDWLAGAGVDIEGLLRAPAYSPRLGGVVARLLDHADSLYARADGGLAALPFDCRPAITAARHLYADIGREIRQAGCDSVSMRHHTTGARKLRLLARAFWATTPAPSDAPALEETRFLVESIGLSARWP